jgi:hypothetical protein
MDDFMNQGAFARTADAGNGHQTSKGKRCVEISDVMAIRALEAKPGVIFLGARSAFFRKRDHAATGEVGTSWGVLDFG